MSSYGLTMEQILGLLCNGWSTKEELVSYLDTNFPNLSDAAKESIINSLTGPDALTLTGDQQQVSADFLSGIIETMFTNGIPEDSESQAAVKKAVEEWYNSEISKIKGWIADGTVGEAEGTSAIETLENLRDQSVETLVAMGTMTTSECKTACGEMKTYFTEAQTVVEGFKELVGEVEGMQKSLNQTLFETGASGAGQLNDNQMLLAMGYIENQANEAKEKIQTAWDEAIASNPDDINSINEYFQGLMNDVETAKQTMYAQLASGQGALTDGGVLIGALTRIKENFINGKDQEAEINPEEVAAYLRELGYSEDLIAQALNSIFPKGGDLTAVVENMDFGLGENLNMQIMKALIENFGSGSEVTPEDVTAALESRGFGQSIIDQVLQSMFNQEYKPTNAYDAGWDVNEVIDAMSGDMDALKNYVATMRENGIIDPTDKNSPFYGMSDTDIIAWYLGVDPSKLEADQKKAFELISQNAEDYGKEPEETPSTNRNNRDTDLTGGTIKEKTSAEIEITDTTITNTEESIENAVEDSKPDEVTTEEDLRVDVLNAETTEGSEGVVEDATEDAAPSDTVIPADATVDLQTVTCTEDSPAKVEEAVKTTTPTNVNVSTKATVDVTSATVTDTSSAVIESAVSSASASVSVSTSANVSSTVTTSVDISGAKTTAFEQGKDVGRYIVEGIETGIANKASSAKDRAVRLASDIASAIRAALKIQSPSRVMAEIGGYMVQGLEVGMQEYTPSLLRSAGYMAQQAISAVEGAASAMNLGGAFGFSTLSDSVNRLNETVAEGNTYTFNIDGKQLASATAEDNNSAINTYSQRIAMGYGRG